jgi:uncharacterized repeat protein (TIGR01451 family)
LLVAGLALVALPAASALADTTVGATDTASTVDTVCWRNSPPVAQLFGDTNYVVPVPGTITSFSFFSTGANATQQLDFLVLRPDPQSAGYYFVVGKTGLKTLAGTGLETFSPVAPITVQPGDILGYWVPIGQPLDNCLQNYFPGGAVTPTTLHQAGDLTDPPVDLTGSIDVSMNADAPNPDSQDLNVSANLLPSAADLSITQQQLPASAVSGKPLTYTITATNTGGQEADNVTVTDPLPAGVRFVSAISTQGTCALARKGGRVTCNVGTLAAGSSGNSATITLVVTPTTAGSLSDTATVAGTDTSNTTISNDSDDIATAQTTVTKKK